MAKPANFIQRHPMLRLLLPLMLGICLADSCWPYFSQLASYLLIVVFAVQLVALMAVVIWSHPVCRRLFSPLFYLCLCSLGVTLATLSLHRSSFPFSNEQEGYAIMIQETPEEKERSILCKSVVERQLSNQGEIPDEKAYGKTFLLYLAKDSASYLLNKGDRLMVYTRLAPAVNNGIPDEFDYPKYLRRQGICGTAYVASSDWRKIGHLDNVSLMDRLQHFRQRIINRYEALGFKGDELAILSALTVGEKAELSEDIKEVYSVAGSSHVLAISGLHLGLIYAILWFVFTPLWRVNRKLKVPLTFCIIVFIWTFAALVGFPTSIVRSAIMFSLIGLSTLLAEKPHSINTLATAAFIMLLIRPMWLFDVGFQMSFAAVFTILWLHPWLASLMPVKNKVLKWIRDLFTLSIAAQVGVAPIVMFYFHRFSVHFMLSNLFIIPVVTLVMCLAVLMLVLTPFPILQQGVAYIENALLKVQNNGLEFVSQLPMASIDRIWIDVFEVILCYLLAWLIYRFAKERTARRTIAALSVVLLLFGYHAVKSYVDLPQRSITFYNVRGCPAVHCIADARHSWIAASDSMQQVSRLYKQASSYWMRRHMVEPALVVNGDLDTPVFQDNQIVTFAGVRIGLLNDNRWRYKESLKKLRLDYLYVSTGFQGRLEEVLQLFDIGEVIIDSSLSDFYRQRIEQECLSKNIPMYRMSERGILCVEL